MDGRVSLPYLPMKAHLSAAPKGLSVWPGTRTESRRTTARAGGSQVPQACSQLRPSTSQETICKALRNMIQRDPAPIHVGQQGCTHGRSSGWARHVGDLRVAADLLGVKDLTATARHVTG